jgi:hypothetical protein
VIKYKKHNLKLRKTMENRPNFDLEAFGNKLPELEEFKEKVSKKTVEIQKESPEAKEKILKQEISEKLNEIQSLSVASLPLTDRDEAGEISQFSPEEQVQFLVSLVFEKGLEKAVSVAKKINNPALLDEFHDILVNKYYEILVNQGVIKP